MRPEELNRLADDVLDHDRVAWEALLAAAHTPEDRELIEQLRTLAAIARLHCAQPDPGTERPSSPSAAGASRPLAASTGSLGRWAHLDLLERLGSGSYGEVFRAWDPHLEREVALKLLYRRPGRTPDEMAVVREARLLARVQHPHVVTVYGAQVAAGRVGLWTELIDGRTLDEIVGTDGPMNVAEAVLIASPVCRALSAVHSAGVLHRDVKAQNVMRARGGRIVLMDFGAGGELAPHEAAEMRALAGSPVYIAPEVVQGAPATVRSDVYSVGVLVYYLLSGAFPVEGGSIQQVREAHARRDPKGILTRRPDLPPAVVRAVERACAPDPAERYADTAALEHALLHALGLSEAGTRMAPTPHAWRRWLLPGIVLTGLVVGGAMLASWWPTGVQVPSFERLTFRQGKIHAARFGAQGGHIVYAASWGLEPPRLFMLTKGAPESLPAGPRNATLLALSPQGEVALALNPRFLRGYVEAGVLARAPLSGGRPRELLDDVQAADWSPDGMNLAVVRDVNGRTRLEFPIGRVLYESSGWISSPRVAPDGSAVAFIDHPTPNDDSGRIALIRGGGPVERLTQGWSSAQGLAWAADGQSLLFTASASGNMRAVHAVGLDGSLRLIHRGAIKMRLHDVSRDGTALVSTSSERVELRARGPKDTKERDLSWFDWSLVRDISRDGQTLLINESGEGGGDQYAIYLRGIDGGDAVRLGHGSGMSISPDGKWVLASVAGHSTSRLALLPTGVGVPRYLPSSGYRYQQWGGWFPDGRRVIFAARGEGKGTQLFVQAVDGRAGPQTITPERVSLGSANAVAPDGSRIAAIGTARQIVLYAPEGRLLGEVPGTQVGEVPIQWTPDGESLYVGRRGGVQTRIYLVDVRSGRRRLWREIVPTEPAGAREIVRVVISRDARTYAYSLTRDFSDLFLMSSVR